MFNNRGVTLTSLSIYIVVSVIVFSSLTFLNINFMSQIADLSIKSEKTNEVLKVECFILNDIKSANSILEYSDKYLKFDNGVEYTVKYRANKNTGSGDSQSYDIYELYRNDVLITDKMATISFDRDVKYDASNKLVAEIVIMTLYYEQEGNLYGNTQYVKVGK